MCLVTVVRYLKHSPTHIKAEISRHKTLYIKMRAITSIVFDGDDCSLTIHTGARSYCMSGINTDIATDIVANSVKL
jgi:hypothetical protein